MSINWLMMLNELCQKNDIKNPTYTFETDSSSDYISWICTGSVFYNNKEITAITEESHRTKGQAKNEVAEKLYNKLKDLTNKSYKIVSFNNPILVSSVKPFSLAEKEKSKILRVFSKIYIINGENQFLSICRKKDNVLYIAFVNGSQFDKSKFNGWREAETNKLLKESNCSNKLLYKIDSVVDYFISTFMSSVVKLVKLTQIETKITIISGNETSLKYCLEKHARWADVEKLIIIK